MKPNNLFFLFFKIGRERQQHGFTLIELIVVVLVVSVLTAIALPSLVNQSTRSRQTEAETNLGSLNRAQQIYRLENPSFATIAQLGSSGTISISAGNYYTYADAVPPTTDIAYMDAVAQTAPRDYSNEVRNYQAAVNQNSTTGDFASIVCRSNDPTSDDAAADSTATFCTGGQEIGE